MERWARAVLTGSACNSAAGCILELAKIIYTLTEEGLRTA
jgi:hypothetical protein